MVPRPQDGGVVRYTHYIPTSHRGGEIRDSNIWSVQLAEQRSSSTVLHVSQTRTGFDDDGNIIFTLEHSLQNISPQFRQWCCCQKTHHQQLHAQHKTLVHLSHQEATAYMSAFIY